MRFNILKEEDVNGENFRLIQMKDSGDYGIQTSITQDLQLGYTRAGAESTYSRIVASHKAA